MDEVTMVVRRLDAAGLEGYACGTLCGNPSRHDYSLFQALGAAAHTAIGCKCDIWQRVHPSK